MARSYTVRSRAIAAHGALLHRTIARMARSYTVRSRAWRAPTPRGRAHGAILHLAVARMARSYNYTCDSV
jgi:hypothetical protein